MSKKIKITEEVRERLGKLAKDLPEIPKFSGGRPVYANAMVDGEELRKYGVKDPATGKLCVPGKLYNTPVLQFENHFERLQRVYRTEGNKGVEIYCSRAVKLGYEFANRMKKKGEASKGVINKIKQIFK